MRSYPYPTTPFRTGFWARISPKAFLLVYLLFSLLFISSYPAFAQTDSLTSITRQFNRYSEQTLPEKLFLHLDRPLYLAGETMWFKIYAVDGTFHQPINLSKVAYVEVLDKEQKPVLQGKIALSEATGQGSFTLPVSLVSGNYFVRAYTSWMKNFSADYYFQSPVTIINTLTNAGVKPTKDSAVYDVQFFPEGGNLVKDLASTVAFKITDKSGRGIDAEGSILDKQGRVLTTFKTLKFGLGQFAFTPTEALRYTATLKLPNGTTITQALPPVYEQGYVMHLEEASPEQLKITVQSNGTGQVVEDIFLLGHARQKLSVALGNRLINGTTAFTFNKKDLAPGISHFTILNARKQPLCERLYFQRPTQSLVITSATDKTNYTAHEKVSLQVTTANQAKEALAANLSVAVYRLDSLPALAPPSINSYLWLSSDLRGTIENPEYYFTSTAPEVTAVANNLMLTQGWRRFRWEDVFKKKVDSLEFIPELNGHLIRGRITNRSTKQPEPNIVTYLASPSRLVRLYNSFSNEKGNLQFEMKDFFGSREIVVQSNTRQDSLYQFEIFNPFSLHYSTSQVPAFTFSEKFKSEIVQRHVQMQVQNTFHKKRAFTLPSPTLDSLPFYGQADEKYRLDDYTRFKVMEEVLREYVPGVQVRIRKDGFHFMVFDKVNKTIFQENPMVLLDGVPVFNLNKIMAVDPLKIQKLEVITSRYFQGTSTYNGLVSFSTYKGDLDGYTMDPHAFVQEYEGLQQQREFYAPRYETTQEKQNRLPDLRNLLYWNPQVNTATTGSEKLEFFTSDKAGKYLIFIQGLSKSGLAGSSNFSFEVKQAL
ncbi:MG2 domain-containing protein [Adhaeribacter radiodurans]|uniref:Macroglobulin domain-containing protein n=1 Tax=Adhaeribacter radiodurans TaxID=2745197 RepID=A0A7L7LB73_9BACT|nr:MG2 domain-containing protein [Adhaeribacter radiodurans]QMU30082.1 hypothetical protein HUW48_19535 [Adhaeribacter radiodurans]